MWWKASGEDIRQAVKLRAEGLSDVWWVCDDYTIYDGQIVAAYPEFWSRLKGAFPSPDRVIEHWSCYSPLKEAPELFMEFARLSEAQNFNEAALVFSRKYGIPGRAYASDVELPHVMDLGNLAKDSKDALRTLKMYEAVINGDPAKADSLMRETFSDMAPPTEGDLAEWEKWNPEEEALKWVAVVVEDAVQKLCVRYLDTEEAVKPPRVDPTKVRPGWLFNNLLGAAYLQMYWLIASAGELKRCEYCGRLNSIARPHPEGRKRRNDKKFCNDACRQAHHREKKKRQKQ